MIREHVQEDIQAQTGMRPSWESKLGNQEQIMVFKTMRLDTFTKAESSYRGGAEQGPVSQKGRCRGDEGDTRAAQEGGRDVGV